MQTQLKPWIRLFFSAYFTLSVGLVWGANCGGATACVCGDTVTSSYTVPSNLTCSSGQGLLVESGVTLDCNNKIISRSPAWVDGNGDSDYGIYLSGVTGAQVTGVTVRNCEVTGFKVGVRFKEASGNFLEDSNIHDNGDAAAQRFYNVEITQNSHNNTLDTVILDDAGDESLHCSGSNGLTITNSTFTDAQNENLYLLSCNDGVYTSNTFGPGGASPGSNSGYIKDSSSNTFTDTTFQNKVLTLIGASSNNVFTGGSTNAGLRIEHYEQTAGDQASYRYPQKNTFTNMTITAVNDCLRIENAVGTKFVGGSLATCTTNVNAISIDSVGNPYKITDITFVGLDPYAGTVSLDAGVTLNIGFLLDVHVQKSGPVDLPGATVQLVDAAGDQVFSVFTGAEGDILQQTVTTRSGRMPVRLTPHRLLVSLPGYYTSSQDLNVTANTATDVTLTPQ